MSNLKQKVIKGTFWMLMERFSIQLVTFAVGIVLARLLSPTEYGTVALLTIFTAIARVLADSCFVMHSFRILTPKGATIACRHKKNQGESRRNSGETTEFFYA